MSAGLIALLLTQVLYSSSSIPKEFCSDWKYMYSLNMEDDPFQKEHDFLEVADSFQRLVAHPCNRNVALYVWKVVFYTRDGFQSSLYPLKFPKAFKVIKTQLTAAEFVEDHVVMLISENIYIYYPNNKSWTPAKGINVKIDGISTNQCCINKEPFCKTISSLVIAYHKSVNISEVSIFLSTNGGLEFEEIRPEMPSEGIFEGAFIFPTISALSLLIRGNQKFYFRYFAVHSNLTPSPFSLNVSDSEPSIIQPVGMKGYVVIWNKYSLLFSPNHGLTVYPFHYHTTLGQQEPFLNENSVILQVIISNKEEIAVLTSDGTIFFASLNINGIIMKVKDFPSVPLGLLIFDKSDDLVIVEPKSGIFHGIFDFLHCVIWIEQELAKYKPHLKPCTVQWFSVENKSIVSYIDVKDNFSHLVVFMPNTKDDGIFMIMVTNPFLVKFQAFTNEYIKTIDSKIIIFMKIFVSLFTVNEKGNYDFIDRMFPVEVSTLTIDFLRDDVLCRSIPAVNIFLVFGCPSAKEIKIFKRVTACSRGLLHTSGLNDYIYVIKKEFYDPSFSFESKTAKEDLIVKYNYNVLGCPEAVHYANAWSPVIQLWENGKFLEELNAEYVMFEVNGINDYSYQLHLYDIACISEVQNWTVMLSQQTNPDPHTAWHSKNYRSCLQPGPTQKASPFAEYQIMGGEFKNHILFAKRNGIYVFKAIVVEPSYSFCNLTTTFSVFVYGAPAETRYSSEMLLGIFILILIFMIWIGFLFQ